MSQTRIGSLVEACANIGTGFVLSFLIQHFVVSPLWGIGHSAVENLQITLLFTVVSIVRSYLWRRYFNWRLHRG